MITSDVKNYEMMYKLGANVEKVEFHDKVT